MQTITWTVNGANAVEVFIGFYEPEEMNEFAPDYYFYEEDKVKAFFSLIGESNLPHEAGDWSTEDLWDATFNKLQEI